jgi:DNA polymerase-4
MPSPKQDQSLQNLSSQLRTSVWPRAIILMDMDAFFASVEQYYRPELRGKPVAITNGMQGTCIITSSYEARARGIKTGMRLRQGYDLCPDLIQQPADPRRYAEVSSNIMNALLDISPDIEVFSVDEAFLDVTHCQKLHGSPERMARMVKQKVFEVSGLSCSIGLSSDKTTAKYAAKQNKPNGICVIPPEKVRATLAPVRVTELCGIASGIGRFLAERGVWTCGDMQQLPIGELARRYGNPGKRIWYMCQGEDPDKVNGYVAPPKSIGHGKVMPPDTHARNVLLTYLMHMSEKVGARLRRHNMQAQYYFLGLLNREGWIGSKMQSLLPTQDGRVIYALAKQMLSQEWQGEGIHQVQITALDPVPAANQPDLFHYPEVDRQHSNQVMDEVNQRYGEMCLAPARLLDRSSMPNVIAPAWKPFGHRQTI